MSGRRLLILAAAAGLLGAQTGVEIEDRLDVVHVDNRVIAVNAATGALVETTLERNEEVVEVASQGGVGVVVTSVRLLGIGVGSPAWQELRLRVRERAAEPPAVRLEDRVALVSLPSRVLAIGGESGRWSELRFGPGEKPRQVFSDAGLATVLTPRRAIAITPGGALVEIPITPQERIEGVSTRPDSVTLTTSHRVLVFRTGALRWAELRRVDRRH